MKHFRRTLSIILVFALMLPVFVVPASASSDEILGKSFNFTSNASYPYNSSDYLALGYYRPQDSVNLPSTSFICNLLDSNGSPYYLEPGTVITFEIAVYAWQSIFLPNEVTPFLISHTNSNSSWPCGYGLIPYPEFYIDSRDPIHFSADIWSATMDGVSFSSYNRSRCGGSFTVPAGGCYSDFIINLCYSPVVPLDKYTYFAIDACSYFYVSETPSGGSSSTTVINVIQSLGTQLIPYVDEIEPYLQMIYNQLVDSTGDSSEACRHLRTIVSALNGMSITLNSLASYGYTMSALLSEIQNTLVNLDVDIDFDVDFNANILAMKNSLKFAADKLLDIHDFLNGDDAPLEEIISQLVESNLTLNSINGQLSSILTRFQNEDIGKDDAREFLRIAANDLAGIYSSFEALSAENKQLAADLATAVNFLVASGASYDTIASLFEAIYTASGALTSAEILEVITLCCSRLQTISDTETDSNSVLKEIKSLIRDIKNTPSHNSPGFNNIFDNSDRGILIKLLLELINRLFSFLEFIIDFFGNALNAIPNLIMSYNGTTGLWGGTSYSYRPYTIGGVGDQSGTAYLENSNDAVKALFNEAEKYIGYPYVWGGSSPSTSFDCSGYVCYCLNASGCYPIERCSAQNLFNKCTSISRFDAMPGDLVFFSGTYDTADAVTHVGFYAGNGKMLHCGDPISYADLNDTYWLNHVYGYGRLPYNEPPAPGLVTQPPSVWEVDTETYSYNFNYDLEIIECEIVEVELVYYDSELEGYYNTSVFADVNPDDCYLELPFYDVILLDDLDSEYALWFSFDDGSYIVSDFFTFYITPFS